MVDTEKEKAMLLLLRQKNFYVNEILRMTKSKLVKSGDIEKDAENFVELVESRASVIKKLEALESEIQQLKATLSENAYTSKGLSYIRETDEMSRQIIDLDKEFMENAPGIRAHFQNKVRTMNKSKRMKDTYDKSHSLEGSYYFDMNK